ncbi:MAG: hypothetical protein NTX86_02135 [Candidatus Dependentiae bacterium]|nr:hypothetical protein [Candidatus Dependentiae bacterium]
MTQTKIVFFSALALIGCTNMQAMDNNNHTRVSPDSLRTSPSLENQNEKTTQSTASTAKLSSQSSSRSSSPSRMREINKDIKKYPGFEKSGHKIDVDLSNQQSQQSTPPTQFKPSSRSISRSAKQSPSSTPSPTNTIWMQQWPINQVEILTPTETQAFSSTYAQTSPRLLDTENLQDRTLPNFANKTKSQILRPTPVRLTVTEEKKIAPSTDNSVQQDSKQNIHQKNEKHNKQAPASCCVIM